MRVLYLCQTRARHLQASILTLLHPALMIDHDGARELRRQDVLGQAELLLQRLHNVLVRSGMHADALAHRVTQEELHDSEDDGKELGRMAHVRDADAQRQASADALHVHLGLRPVELTELHRLAGDHEHDPLALCDIVVFQHGMDHVPQRPTQGFTRVLRSILMRRIHQDQWPAGVGLARSQWLHESQVDGDVIILERTVQGERQECLVRSETFNSPFPILTVSLGRKVDMEDFRSKEHQLEVVIQLVGTFVLRLMDAGSLILRHLLDELMELLQLPLDELRALLRVQLTAAVRFRRLEGDIWRWSRHAD
mmetsp:Transcript_19498/g.54197  ORF Transcript_19498/g.54197 Transcript_19498/m.54197 type:complete len:310 (-) Transcript_19498:177-1106(-)